MTHARNTHPRHASPTECRMTKTTPAGDVCLYRPREVAKQLGCSEWWVKEQARNRRIPYAWIGGRYLFTADHVAAIVTIFEQRPPESAGAGVADSGNSRDSRTAARRSTAPVARLRARTPRRARGVPTQPNAA
ncbi:helix-turn-helix domain-containing protein [Actinosynnema sp. NPDC023587]|uniref:helix-turn-helix domain-containing protein n=1 Tax=Actinosynnema sp. NPDC023587 TaxID=3154695 RepID=UPI0033D60F5E